MKVQLLKPPSVNHIYGLTSSGKFARSYITKEGVTWFTEAAAKIGKIFKRKTIIDPVEVWIELYHIRNQDVDNINKPILDVLSKWCLKCQTKIELRKGCKCGKNFKVLDDDDQVYKLTTEKWKIKKDDSEGERIIVEIMGYS